MFLSVLHTFRYRPNFSARLAIVLMALLYTWVANATVLSTSHDPVAWAGHGDAVLQPVQAGSHDHHHDALDDTSGNAGHVHDQHSPDHSHEPPALPPHNVHPALNLADSWTERQLAAASPAPCFPFERPPKGVPAH